MKTLFSSIINIDYTDQGLNCGGLSYQVSQGMGNHQVWTTRWRYGLHCGLRILVQGGKCGVCGDAYGDVEPRQHEDGGKYGKGIITAQYQPGFEPSLIHKFLWNQIEFSTLKKPGQVIQTSTQITAHHKGFVEFKLCPRNDETMTGDELQVLFI